MLPLHHDLARESGYAFSAVCIEHVAYSLAELLNRYSSRAPRSRTETLLLPKQACSLLHLYPIIGVTWL